MPEQDIPILSNHRTSKVLWIDLETTGVHPDSCAILQLVALIEKDDVIEEEIEILMCPFTGAEVTQAALDINGRSETEIYTYPSPEDGMLQFLKFVDRHINKYNKEDKAVLAGYNVKFDADFLRNYFEYVDVKKYFNSYFFSPLLDIIGFVAHLIKMKGLRLPNYKLKTVCNAFDIQFDAHDALADIMATRKLYDKLYSLLFINEVSKPKNERSTELTAESTH